MTYDDAVSTNATLHSRNMKDWQRVGEAIVSRRVSRQMSQRDFATKADVGTQAINRLENARQDTIRKTTASAIEYVLGWQQGAIEDLLYNGIEPELTEVAIANDTESDAIRELQKQVDRLTERLKKLENAIESGDVVNLVLQQVVKKLRQR